MRLKYKMAIVVGMAVGLPMLAYAEAGEGFILPGTSCKYYGPQSSDTFMDPANLSANGLRNTSGSSKYVVCPIPKQNDLDDQLTALVQVAHVWAFMSSSAGNCSLYRRDLGATSWANWSATTISAQQNTWSYDIAPPGGANAFSNTWQSSTSVYCQLPANAYINNFKWTMWITRL